MKGVQYLFDEKGNPTAVLIDLRKNFKLWEDIQDILVARERQKEPRLPFSKAAAGTKRKRVA